MESITPVLLLCAFLAAPGTNAQSAEPTQAPQTPHRFQAEKFLDMLGRSYDSQLAYADLLSSLHRRLNLDPASQSNSSTSTADAGTATSNTMAETTANCPEAPFRKGATITYTSEGHVLGSRALYQCEAGYSGRSQFIQCLNGGQWSQLSDWQGCIPGDCGPVPPGVQNADTSYTTTTVGSTVLYTCQSGYKMNISNANVTCLETVLWETPTFACEKANNLPNPMMAAFLQSMSGMPGMPNMPSLGQAPNPSVLPSSSNANNPMAAMFAQMFPNMASQLPSATPPPPTTTTTVKPTVAPRPGGFQLPNHLQNLLPHGLSSATGIRPDNLMTLLSAGLGSAHPAAAPRDLNQLLGTMNPMSVFGSAMGMNMGGMSPGGTGIGTGPGGVPLDPERMAEQREEMMMRAMMASAMKSMMGPAGQANTNSNQNPAGDIMSLLALQSGISGGGGAGGAGGAAAGFDPLSMMFGGMNLFGQA